MLFWVQALTIFLNECTSQVKTITTTGNRDRRMKVAGKVMLIVFILSLIWEQFDPPLPTQVTKALPSATISMSAKMYVTKPVNPSPMFTIIIAVILSSAIPTFVTFFLAKSFFSTKSYGDELWVIRAAGPLSNTSKLISTLSLST